MLEQEEFQIQLEKIEQPISRQDHSTTILFVIQGHVNLTIGENSYLLSEDDLYIVNRNEFYSLSRETDNILIALQIKSPFFVQHFSNYYQYYFDCFSKKMDTGREKIVASLRHALTLLIINSFNPTENSQLISHNAIFKIMLLLAKFFKKEQAQNQLDLPEDDRLSRIITFLENHYDENITLGKIAEREFLSPSYLSRYFKARTGLGFLQYLMQIRLKHSLSDLLLTDEAISSISFKNGFSSSKHFTDAFKAYYKETPSQYREKHSGQGQANTFLPCSNDVTIISELSPELLERLGKYQFEAAQETELSPVPIEQKTISLTNGNAGSLKHPLYLLTIGEMKELLKDNVKKQIETVQREIRLDFIGIRHLLRGNTFLPEVETDEAVPTFSTYANADLALSYLKTKGLRPFIRIEYQELSLNEEHYFEQLSHFIRHSIQVFGRAFVSSWAFMYYESEQTLVSAHELKRLFLRLKACFKEIEPKIKLSTFVPFSERGAVPSAHQWIFEAKSDIDFLTYHANPNEIIDFSKGNELTFHDADHYTLTKTKKT
ncbi:amino-terminal domain-containing protein [Listeria floridensis FSL S10-1187]|uniref:Amino-terminal domain-containing protein n=1 Tax=Listeria floridensis FSL S10-1187 TaxID=1265817 RepID=A0ABP3AYY4_9LIST|nr:helix-turn-helix domain-containing protein [Listeria floridensis]EUJ29718.1 amino-terminal domain-containing protein [Listeria floridensis FSL S10-1187]